MSTEISKPQQEIYYPDSDGKPMADNTLQFRWIVTIKEGLDLLLPNDFVAGDLFWYPIEGNPFTKIAPDVLVALGRPKGDRRSYKQWEENHVTPQVVFEILSHSNTWPEMRDKLQFYQHFRVQEYYLYDPEQVLYDSRLLGWHLVDGRLIEITPIDGWISPLLNIRFDMSGEELRIYHPDGRPFLSFLELETERILQFQRAEVERQRADSEHERAESEYQRAEMESQRAEMESQRAEMESQRAEMERQKAEEAELKAKRLAEKLRALGIDPSEV